MTVLVSLGLTLAAAVVCCGGSSGGQRPVYGSDQRPVYGSDQRPVYGSDQRPVYGSDQRPVYGSDQRPVYGSDQRPVYGRGADNIVRTSHGLVQGRTENVSVSDGRLQEVDVFWGIPYARPPVGALRFRRPASAHPWPGVLQATTPPASCVQIPLDESFPIRSPPPPFSEDCLYVNIWRPRCSCGGGQRLSTMVWIHGGGFVAGSTTEEVHDGATLAASECVIVASMNYRLGALGLLHLGVEDCPGNMALVDMALATAWIRKNVANFGGDPGSITIFGNSVGGISTSLFLVSPLTRHLFKNAIIQSGNLFLGSQQQTRESALRSAGELTRRLNCSSENRSLQVECLRQVNATDLALVRLLLSINNVFPMLPVIDDYFLTQDPLVSLQTGDFKRCNILTGTTRDEGTFFLSVTRPDTFIARRPLPAGNLTEQVIDETLIQFLLGIFKPEFIPGVVGQVRDLYDYNSLQRKAENPGLALLNRVISELYVVCPSIRLAQFYTNNSQDVFLYSFNHPRDNSTFASWVGASHTSEIPFVFGTTTPDVPEFSPREATLNQAMMRMWADFAKSGNPTPGPRDTPRWPRYSPPDPANILEFTESAQIRPGRTQSRRCAYWDSLPREYFRN